MNAVLFTVLAAESVLSWNNTLRALTLNAYRNFVLNSCAVQFTCYTCPGGRQPSTTLLTHGERQMLPRRIKHPGLWWTAYLYFCFFFLLFFPFSFFFASGVQKACWPALRPAINGLAFKMEGISRQFHYVACAWNWWHVWRQKKSKKFEKFDYFLLYFLYL